MASRPFYDFLREHRNGVTHDELSDALNSLVADVTAEGKAGKLTLTISIKPADTKDGALMVVDDIKVTPPKKTKSGSIFFVSPENNLVRQDPKQHNLPLRDINGAPEVREIGPSMAHKGVA